MTPVAEDVRIVALPEIDEPAPVDGRDAGALGALDAKGAGLQVGAVAHPVDEYFLGLGVGAGGGGATLVIAAERIEQRGVVGRHR